MEKVVSVILALPTSNSFDYLVPDHLLDDIAIGKRVQIEFGKSIKIGFIYKIKNKTNQNTLKPINKVLDKEPALSQESWDLAHNLSLYYACSFGEALKLFVPKNHSIRTKKGEENLSDNELKPFLKPTPCQEECLNQIYKSILGSSQKFLLDGVAGSGKTEVYFHAIKKVLEQNKSAIYLLPEIALTPQILDGLKERFGSFVSVWHSKLTDREKFLIWQNIRSGEIKILVGARSAVFAPFKNLGLIVIDEEHEDTFKQTTKPCYDARLIARWRSDYNNATLILGSATPSIESYYLMNKGYYKLLSLKRKIKEYVYNNYEKLNVSVVDMKQELDRKNFGIFSYKLYVAIKKRLEKGEQIILFLNRRGHTTYVFCRKCGFKAECPNCGVSLVYHFDKNKLLCHYCGHTKENYKICPECNSKYIKHFGVGVQKVEEDLRKIFKGIKVSRLDQDTTKKKSDLEKIYREFKSGKIDVLLGTQMVTKGFDFPNVTLVGVISSDTAMNLPDFRSSERIYSLLVQVVGRSGRRKLGEAIIQTYYPTHYSILNASKFDYDSFYNEEIKWRKKLSYPPFSRLVNIVFRGKDESVVLKEADRFKKFFDNENNDLVILGPTASGIKKMYGKFRYQLVIKELVEYTGDFSRDWLDILAGFRIKKGINVNIDVDPVSLL